MMSERSHEAGLENQFVLEDQADGSKIPVEGDVKIGRDAGCELVLDCTKCSRLHARMETADGALWVEDQNSTNGTLVNNREITERTRLEDGDVVQFGDARFRVNAPVRQAPEDDGEKTVVVSRDNLQQMLDASNESGLYAGKDVTPAKSNGGGDFAKPEGSAKPAEPIATDHSPASSGGPAYEAKHQSISESRPGTGERGGKASAEASDADGPRRPEVAPESTAAEAASPGSTGGVDPSIPRSWADAEQLEQASYTSVLVGGLASKEDINSRTLDPSKAIAQVRRQIPADLAILLGLTEPVQGTLFELHNEQGQAKWEIGRGEGADIEIDADSVSGRHSQLIHEKGRWKIVNMMSVNGTFVNGRKVLSAYLKSGDIIRMGGVELVFDARIDKSASRTRSDKPSPDAISPAGKLFRASVRWVVRQWSRLRGKS